MQLSRPVCTEVGEKIALSRRVDKHWRLIGPCCRCCCCHLPRQLTPLAAGWGRINTGKRMAINTAPITATAAAFKSGLHNDGLDVEEDEDAAKAGAKDAGAEGDE